RRTTPPWPMGSAPRRGEPRSGVGGSRQETSDAEIRKRRAREGRERDAEAQARNPEERPEREDREEPQAGDRHRFVGGPGEGGQGAAGPQGASKEIEVEFESRPEQRWEAARASRIRQPMRKGKARMAATTRDSRKTPARGRRRPPG